MGYRNDVAIAIKASDFEDMKKELEEINQIEILHYADVNYNDERTVVVLYWQDVKWADGWEDVDAVMEFIYGLTTYKFIRIGEYYEDIEYVWNIPSVEFCTELDYEVTDAISLNRSIDFGI